MDKLPVGTKVLAKMITSENAHIGLKNGQLRTGTILNPDLVAISLANGGELFCFYTNNSTWDASCKLLRVLGEADA